jgi:heavy metal translocating P-type ATPase
MKLRESWNLVARASFPLLVVLLCTGAALYAASEPASATLAWQAGTAIALAVLTIEILKNALRGQFALDVVAAVAMATALALDEPLTGMIIAVMYSGGQALENFAQGRVAREMNALLAGAPRNASRYRDGRLEEVPVSAIIRGDRMLIKRGEVVPVDGRICSASAILDQSTLTGEALPVRLQADDPVLSGTTNSGEAFEMEASSSSADSTYAGIVRLVEAAQKSKAPIMRIADRYALLFLLLTIATSVAAWLLSGDPHRALAVLVVATPCPLILAVPVAILSGVSHCARRGVLVKGGEALERLAAVNIVLLDKTGTITDGRARLIETKTYDGLEPQFLLRLAASLDQGSPHVFAQALVAAARARGLTLESPEEIEEQPGSGLQGRVGTHQVALGGSGFILSKGCDPQRIAEIDVWATSKRASTVIVAIDGRVAGALLLADHIRPEAPTVLRQLRESGVDRIVLLTGDHAELAAAVAAYLGLDGFKSDMKPSDKSTAVQAEKANGRVLMVGDGVNDAPALAAADVGVAMGARGAAASSEAADVVILLDRLDRLVTALRIARRSRAIALQSAFAGIALSLVAMVAAMLGYLPAIEGAVLQEVIDVAVILNALRALGRPNWLQSSSVSAKELLALEDEHRHLSGIVDEIRSAADAVPYLSYIELRQRLGQLEALLNEHLLPHERRDESELYPRLNGKSGNVHAMTGMSRTHMEIRRRCNSFGALVRSLSSTPSDAERREIQRLLDGLDAITRLHFDQEEEIYRMLEAN